ncbi:Ribosomal protein S35, mitochondrial [Cordyceps fumosorosea ARSEF 2679]|uniref:Ribosomal protein S35, mitochondrial n=1 Tax=Cordyceps fumosorosea (strain ARSEF 2679) TaxID=1081104 RepID=A0A167LN50_CORFA|nr:Ribosomal protein S35, mitochondrial [Cordyceps fumosorosea ARSEF 2679]OAA53286.1 Ribosomal protein S35, mitochondrial [Cordyceps fumosorosea ARSEF 2679]
MPPRVSARAPVAAADALLLSTSRPRAVAAAPQTCAFSATPCREKSSAARRKMFAWIHSAKGRVLANNSGPGTLSGQPDVPFPNNPLFRSERVVNDATKHLIYQRATQEGQALKAIAAEMGLDVRRVAAIVRLKEAQKQWTNSGKKLATPYSKAVQGLLPKWGYYPGEPQQTPFEPVNDIHVHRYTMQQLFVPVAESTEFTREDAAAAFYDNMLSVDKRSPQSGLIDMERRNIAKKGSRKANWQAFQEAERQREDEFAERLAAEQAALEAATTLVKSDRYEFRFREMNADDAGTDGRSHKGLGWRYGAPHMDRKRGMIKIPKTVP